MMRTPEQVIAYLRKQFDDNYPDWARRRGRRWPMRIDLQQPGPAERSADPVECHAWAGVWREYAGPGTVEYSNIRFPTGTHSMPKSLVLAGPGTVAAIDPMTAAVWKRCGERLIELQSQFPDARFDGLIRRIADLSDIDYERLVKAVDWLQQNPTSGMLLRQIPIEGLGSKWLGVHARFVLALLGRDGTISDDTERAETGISARIQLHSRLGLRVPPDLIQVAVLDDLLRTQFSGMRNFAAGVDDLNKWSCRPHTVVILENKETGYAVTDDLAGTVILHGQGFSVPHYARIEWIRTARTVIYWGDVDIPGFEILDGLRSTGIPVRTVLMDMATLTRYRHLAIDGAGPGRIAPTHLTPSEDAVYRHLLDHIADNGAGLLLEQERIPWAHAYPVLAEAMSG